MHDDSLFQESLEYVPKTDVLEHSVGISTCQMVDWLVYDCWPSNLDFSSRGIFDSYLTYGQGWI